MGRTSGSLGKRDREVLRLLAAGWTNKQIAAELGLSQNSVDKMLSNAEDTRAIYPKIGVTNAKSAVTWYLQNNSAQPAEAPAPIAPGAAPELADDATPLPVPPAPHPPAGLLHPVALTAFGAIGISVVLFLFLPFLADPVQSLADSAFLNIYLVVPLIAGLYTLFVSPTPRIDSRFLWGFRLFALGLISWSVGAIIYAVYDLLRGMQPHYPSLADLGFLSQSALQTAAFALWWYEVRRRGGPGGVYWLAIALPVYVAYAAVVLAIRHIWQNQPVEQTIVIDAISSFFDCASLAFAIMLLFPRAQRLLDAPMRGVMHLMAAGMGMMFLAGFVYFVSLAVPEDHWFYYGYGGWVDLLFLSAFLLSGFGLIQSTRRDRAFANEVTAAPAGVLEPSSAGSPTLL